MKTENKIKRAFNYDESKNLQFELNEYINKNLYSNSITIQSNKKIYVFNWCFLPQKTGTIYQQLTYKNLATIKKADEIINHINKENEKI